MNHKLTPAMDAMLIAALTAPSDALVGTTWKALERRGLATIVHNAYCGVDTRRLTKQGRTLALFILDELHRHALVEDAEREAVADAEQLLAEATLQLGPAVKLVTEPESVLAQIGRCWAGMADVRSIWRAWERGDMVTAYALATEQLDRQADAEAASDWLVAQIARPLTPAERAVLFTAFNTVRWDMAYTALAYEPLALKREPETFAEALGLDELPPDFTAPPSPRLRAEQRQRRYAETAEHVHVIARKQPAAPMSFAEAFGLPALPAGYPLPTDADAERGPGCDATCGCGLAEPHHAGPDGDER